jgi:RNA polymerase sigma-70 factor (ECF subfamily)
VVATTLVDAVRRRRARPEEPLMTEGNALSAGGGEPHAAGPSPEVAAGHAELLDAVESQLEAMPERRRLAVRLHLQGFDTSEVGRLAGWSEPKARNLVYRGLDELRRRLRERGIQYEGE